ncbi:MAG: hypothetical protein CVT88_07715 [Candidatus Altiarchaeales archaeon HGW-Altiarchaeales-1]|nr:MAG: hypothetical protein CVT88_07715 [Candidatus Altiarchaeales archaeon HGW-Altiarchaeales-1]
MEQKYIMLGIFGVILMLSVGIVVSENAKEYKIETVSEILSEHVGGEAVIRINMSGENLLGTGFDVLFDNEILEAISVEEGSIMKKCKKTTFEALPPEINNTKGIVTFQDLCLGEAVSENGNVAVIKFTSKKIGKSYIKLNNTYLFDKNGDPINISPVLAGNVFVSVGHPMYNASLKIEKVSGEKYGDVFVFKVLSVEGKPVEGAKVKILNNVLYTDTNGTAEIILKHTGNFEVAAEKENYTSCSDMFNLQPLGNLKIIVPEDINLGDEISIKIAYSNETPAGGVKVSIKDESFVTDETGEIKYNIGKGVVKISAEKEGYKGDEKEIFAKGGIVCGDKKCEGNENCKTCEEDCGKCIVCGDKKCEGNETAQNCPGDCDSSSSMWTIIAVIAAIVVIILIVAIIMSKKKKQNR